MSTTICNMWRVAIGYKLPYVNFVSIAWVKWISVWWVKSLNISQAWDLKLLWFLLNDLAVESLHQGRGVKEQRPIWEGQVSLLDRPQVVSSDACLPCNTMLACTYIKIVISYIFNCKLLNCLLYKSHLRTIQLLELQEHINHLWHVLTGTKSCIHYSWSL